MLLTQKLLRYLNRVFDKDPKAFLAFRLRYTSGAFSWVVEDDVLRGFNGTTELFSVDLGSHTVGSLIGWLQTVPGISIPYSAPAEYLGLSARVLIDGSGQQVVQDGDAVRGFTSLLWSYMDAMAAELVEAEKQVRATIRQMTISEADTEWLEEWGSFFGVIRQSGETLTAYAKRIVDDTIRIRGNNKGLEQAILARFGQLSTVTDLTRFGAAFPLYNGVITHNGSQTYNAVNQPIYGLFKITVGYDLLGGSDPADFAIDVRKFIENIRHAGTHLESVELAGSILMDSVSAPVDESNVQTLSGVLSLSDTVTGVTDGSFAIAASLAQLTDSVTAPTESSSIDVAYATTFNSQRSFNSAVPYASGSSIPEALS